ncbi:MAG: CoA-binding protein [Treponema sp.]|jgi:redox-sensing transcriptional repressor|nr:CoA-binding protein [Treponema sp.]
MDIPPAAKERLLHILRILETSNGGAFTSPELEALTGWPSHTIRKDISYLAAGLAPDEPGGFGTSAGYGPEKLAPAIRQGLGLDRRRGFCVVGLGRLGSAFLNTDWNAGASGFEGGEFELAAGFDINVNRVEILKSPAPLYPSYKMAEVIRRFGIEIALLCVPETSAQSAAEKLAAAGIQGIVNFAPAALALPPAVTVQNVYVVDQLRALAVKMPPAGVPQTNGDLSGLSQS